jgi:hypothetical protein
MFTRRSLVVGAAFAGIAKTFGGRSLAAQALQATEASGRALDANSNLALASRDHLPLIAETQSKLRRDIALGIALKDAQRSVVCPICCYRITVTANACF